MITIYQLFKIIFGVIVSALVLYFLISYSGVYSSISESSMKAATMRTFVEECQRVYTTGVPTNFSGLDFDVYLDADSKPPVLKFDLGEIPTFVPVLFSQGEDMVIERNYLDYGWWRFYFVQAMPEMIIIFNPVEGSEDVWDAAELITLLFPETSYIEGANVSFGFCDGNSLVRFCDDEFCDGFEFMNVIESMSVSGVSFDRCSFLFPSDKYRLVTISSSCSPKFAVNGVCVNPVDETFFIRGVQKTFYYFDALDVVSAIIGGEGLDPFGMKTQGETLYIYKNNMFIERLEVASDFMSERARLLADVSPDCRNLFLNLANELESVNSIISNPGYSFTQLRSRLISSKQAFEDLVGQGCDYDYITGGGV